MTTHGKTLDQLAADCLRANGALCAAILGTLSPGRVDQLEKLIAAGGRCGIESTLDAAGTSQVVLVGLTADNGRMLLTTVQTVAAGPPARLERSSA